MESTDAASPPILEFHEVTITTPTSRYVSLRDVSFTLQQGELMLIRIDPGSPELPLAAAAQGMIPVDAGTIRFLDEPWDESVPAEIARRRGLIGRVFDSPAWVSNLNVVENVTLAQRHHTRRPAREIESEAEELARSFGLSRIPTTRPSFTAPRELRRLEWVRACLGHPRLLLMQRPLRGADHQKLGSLIAAFDEARRRGTAVLWITELDRVYNGRFSPPIQRYTVTGETMVPERKNVA